ncbi:pseudouridine synthase [Mucilaginibacter litoreus]|uniref:Pseudouridine synthase n=1 Tax=Mucilaginibacter litoreus TaxID=1048221 RepID=A0ABW3AVG1_9SPHI
MVFKRPAGSRDDRPGRSSGRSNNRAENSKRTSSSAPFRNSDNDQKPYGDRKPSPTNPKPFSRKSGSEDARPGRRFNAPSGDKKSFAPKGKPYTGRPEGDDRPKGKYGEQATGGKKGFAPKGKPYSGRPESGDSPKRNFGEGRGSGYSNSTGKKDFKSTTSGFKRRDDRAEEQPVRTMRGRKNPKEKAPQSDLIRLNRYIANAGICSRRKADELIAAGVISVNGEVVSELGHKVDPFKDVVRYNGEPLKREKMVYVLLNKPKDYITTTDDPQERRTVMHLVEKASRERIYPVGRLDRNTTGLLLMTNDGDLADKLSHPRNNIVKLYNVELNKSLTQGDLNKIGFGLELEDGFIKPDSISYVTGASKKEVGIQIHSGKNRIVRRIFESLGYEVVKLDRSVYANLTKKDLPRGRWRFLDEKEVIQLKHLI